MAMKSVQGGMRQGTANGDWWDTFTFSYHPDIQEDVATIYSGINGLGGDDNLSNDNGYSNVTLDGDADNDTIKHYGGSYALLVGGDGNDHIYNYQYYEVVPKNVTIDAGQGDDYINNYGNNSSISGGEGDDRIETYGDNVTIEAGAGDDDVDSRYGSDVIIRGGEGNDSLSSYADDNTIAANVLLEDTIGNNSFGLTGNENSTVIGGDGDDTINVYNTDTSNDGSLINMGAGNNYINGANDTNSTIIALDGDDTINLFSGNGISIDAGAGANQIFVSNRGTNYITYPLSQNYTVNSGADADSIYANADNLLINAGDGDNTILSGQTSGGKNVTINTGAGNDLIYGGDYNRSDSHENNVINSGAGNDIVRNQADKSTVIAGEGDDTIDNYGENVFIDGGDGNEDIYDGSSTDIGGVTVNGGAGDDSIYIWSSNSSINGGAGDDSIISHGNNSTINGGTGNDTIGNGGANVTFVYAAGDGNDIITGFNETSTLSIGGATYSSQISGEDITINVGDGSIILQNAATLDALNIIGEEGITTIPNSDFNVVVTGTDAAEQFENKGYNVAIDALGGNDTINNYGGNVSINAGTGDDLINTDLDASADDVTVHYAAGDGNDSISGHMSDDGAMNYKLQITGSTYSSVISGDDVILTVGTDSILLYEAASSAEMGGIDIDGTLEGSGVNVTNEDDDKTITGTEYSDTINNSGARVLIMSYGGRDSIINSGASTAILSGDDDDIINNGAANVTIDSGTGNDVIGNIGANNSIVSGAGNNSVDNEYGYNSTITTGEGDDTINNYNSEDVLIEAGAGADFIYSHGSVTGSTIDAGDGDDTIRNSGDGVYIVAGSGDDSIDNTGATVTVDLGAGDDYIFSTVANSSISGGEGNDSIQNGGYKYPSNGGSYTVRGGDNVTMNGGDGDDYLSNYSADYVVIDGGAGNDYISNSYGNYATITDLSGDNTIRNGGGVDRGGGHSSAITTGDGNDYINISTYANDVTVNSGGGNDWVVGQWNERMLVQTGAGNDTIGTNGCTSSTLDAGAGDDLISVIDVNSYVVAGAGNDSIYFQGNHTTIEAGDGDDTITHGSNDGYNMYLDGGRGNDLINGTAEGTLIGGAGNDTITTNGWNNIINGGAGNDLITLRSSNDTIVYEAGDGNDTILGFGEFVTDIGAHALSISGGTYASQTSGEDVSITVGKGSILLRGAAKLDTLNIIGEEEEGPTWHLDDDGNATYGTSDKTEVTLTGIGSLDGVKLDGKTVTLSAAALNGENVTITKGYTLKIDGTVPTSSKKIAATWTSDGDEHTYTAAGTPAYYKLSSNKLTFTPAKGGETFTLTGIASTSGVKVSGTKVTIGKTALGDSDITLTSDDGFTLELDKSVTAAKEISAGWKKFTYTAAGTTEGYKLDGDTITHTAATGGEQFTISGLKNTSDVTVEDYVVTIGAGSLNGKAVTFSGDDFEFVLGEDVPTSADEVEGKFTSVTKGTATYRTAHTSEAYTLGDGTITYTAAVGGQDIKISNLNTSATLDDMAGAIEVVESDDGVHIIFMDAAVLTTKAPTITAPKSVKYTVAVDEALSTAEETLNWKPKGTAATLSADTGATYTVKGNKVVYTKAKSGTAQAVLTGLAKDAELATPEENVITLDAENLGTKTSLKSNAGGYSIELTGDMSGKTFVGSTGADTIDIAADNALVDGGKGNDEFDISGADVTIISSAGNDTTNFAYGLTVSLIGTTTVKELAQTDSGVQLTFSNKATLTVTDVDDTFEVVGKNQNFAVDLSKFALANSLTFDKTTSPTSVTVDENFTGALLQADDLYLGGGKLSNVATFDASNVTGNIFIEGNAKANTLHGGLSSTTLEGGKGNDLFVFNGGELTISDYGNGSDKIDLGGYEIAGAAVDKTSDDKSRDLVLTLSDGENDGTLNIIGGGKDAKGKDVKISFNGDKNAYIFETDKIYNSGRTAVTLLGADGDLSGEPKVKAITAAESFTGEEIIGNTAANTIDGNSAANYIDGGAGNDKIFGNGGDNTLWGGAGNDTLIGGDDSDTFIYTAGKDVITGFADNDLLQITGDFTTSVNKTGTEIAFTVGKGSLTLKDFTAENFNINDEVYQVDSLPNRK